MDEREEIIELMKKLTKPLHTGGHHELGWTMKRWELELVADFLLARESRLKTKYDLLKFANKNLGKLLDWATENSNRQVLKICEQKKDHETLVNTILTTKNEEIERLKSENAELTEEVKKGMKQAVINEELRKTIKAMREPLEMVEKRFGEYCKQD